MCLQTFFMPEMEDFESIEDIRERVPRLAEGVGFEPTRACALPVFKTGALDRSATLPWGPAS